MEGTRQMGHVVRAMGTQSVANGLMEHVALYMV